MSRRRRDADTHPQAIILSPEKASDFEGELPALADALSDSLEDVAIEIRDPLKGPPGASIPAEAVQVLTAIFPYAAGYYFDRAVDLITEKLRAALREGKNKDTVRIVKIYGPGGEILKQVKIPAENPEPEGD